MDEIVKYYVSRDGRILHIDIDSVGFVSFSAEAHTIHWTEDGEPYIKDCIKRGECLLWRSVERDTRFTKVLIENGRVACFFPEELRREAIQQKTIYKLTGGK